MAIRFAQVTGQRAALYGSCRAGRRPIPGPQIHAEQHSPFGTYRLVDLDTSEVVISDQRTGYGLSLDEVEDFLDRGRRW